MKNVAVIPKLKPEPIRVAMASLGLSNYDELADELGMARATIVRIMSGKQAPSMPFAASVHVRLGLPWDMFLDSGPRKAKPRNRRTLAHIDIPA